MSALKTVWAACIVAFVLGAAASEMGHPELSNDSAEYDSIAQHMAAGDGFLTDLKLYLCNPGPVRHSAMGERQPAYPAALALGPAELVVPLLAGLALAAIVALAGGLFGAAAAWICVPVVVLGPALVGADTVVGPTGMYIMWLALFVLAANAAMKDLRWSLAVGLLWALMALTRGEGMLVGVAALIWLGVNRSWKALAVSLGVFILAMIPYFAFNAHVTGSAFTSLSSLHMKVRTFGECMWYGYGLKLPSTMQFLSRNLKYAVGLSVRNFLVYALSLLRLSWLGAGIAVLAYAVATDRKSWPKEGLILPIVGGMQCFAIASMWSTTSGRAEPEHLAPPLLALAIPAVGWAIWKASREKAWVAVMIAAVLLATYAGSHFVRGGEASSTATELASYAPAADGPGREIGSDDVIAADHPWPVWWQARRPIVLLPRRLSAEEQVRFLREYQVRAIVAWPSEAKPWMGLPGVRVIFMDKRGGAVALSVDQSALPRSP
jgi:hypothetical protein